MKKKASLILTLFFSFGAAIADAASAKAPLDTPLAESAVSFSSLLNGSADCGSPLISPFANTSPSIALTDYCGSCSFNPCKGAALFSICGPGDGMGHLPRCKNLLALYCGGVAEGPGKCTCTFNEIP